MNRLAQKIRRFLALRSNEKYCLIYSAVVLWQVRVRLWATSYAATKSWTDNRVIKLKENNKEQLLSHETVICMIEGASLLVPCTTCLVRAMAAALVLRRYGYSSVLKIGVRKSNKCGFEAHAWLEKDGIIIIGGQFSDTFRPIYDDQATP